MPGAPPARSDFSSSSVLRSALAACCSWRRRSQTRKNSSIFPSSAWTAATAGSVRSPSGTRFGELCGLAFQLRNALPPSRKRESCASPTPFSPLRSGALPTTDITSRAKSATSASGTSVGGTTPSPLASVLA